MHDENSDYNINNDSDSDSDDDLIGCKFVIIKLKEKLGIIK